MNTILIILFIVFIFSILMLIKSIHILNTLNNIKEPFYNFENSGSIEFFYTKSCSLCPLAKQKILKNLGKGTSFIERNLTRIMKKKQVCDGKKCITVEYEDYENESDGKRAESLSISWTSVPVAVIQASSVTTIMYLTSDIVNKL